MTNTYRSRYIMDVDNPLRNEDLRQTPSPGWEVTGKVLSQVDDLTLIETRSNKYIVLKGKKIR